MQNCKVCNAVIPEIRVKAFLPKIIDVCIEHANPARPFGRMIYGHKTAGEICIVDANNPEHVRQLNRAFQRSR